MKKITLFLLCFFSVCFVTHAANTTFSLRVKKPGGWSTLGIQACCTTPDPDPTPDPMPDPDPDPDPEEEPEIIEIGNEDEEEITVTIILPPELIEQEEEVIEIIEEPTEAIEEPIEIVEELVEEVDQIEEIDEAWVEVPIVTPPSDTTPTNIDVVIQPDTTFELEYIPPVESIEEIQFLWGDEASTFSTGDFRWETIKNTGNIPTRVTYEYTIVDTTFSTPLRKETKHIVMYPGATYDIVENLDDAGIFGPRVAQLEIYQQKRGEARSLVLNLAHKFWQIPWGIISAAIITFFSWWILLLLARYSLWVPYIVQRGDTVEKLSVAYDLRKSKFARINDIQKWYKLKKGEEILVPRFRNKEKVIAKLHHNI